MFGDMSPSQINEKMDWVTEFVTIEDQKSSDSRGAHTLITVISLGSSGLLAESEQAHIEKWREWSSGSK